MDSIKRNLLLGIVGTIILGAASYILDYNQTVRKVAEKEGAFKSIPEVYSLDSAYNAATKAYHLQRDSLRKMYEGRLEEIVGGR